MIYTNGNEHYLTKFILSIIIPGPLNTDPTPQKDNSVAAVKMTNENKLFLLLVYVYEARCYMHLRANKFIKPAL